MAWIKNNERRPKHSGYYQTIDSVGRISGTSFNSGLWYSHTGHPVDEWYEDGDLASNCCGAKVYSPDGESYTCMDCKEPCEAIHDLDEE